MQYFPKAVIYARYSSHSQTEQSIEGELTQCHAYAHQTMANPNMRYIFVDGLFGIVIRR